MATAPPPPSLRHSLPEPPRHARLPFPYRDESATLAQLLPALAGLDWSRVVRTARPWVESVRDTPAPFWALESLLHEYPISSAEGLALMRLAEALLRVPDAATAIALTADQLGRADFGTPSEGPHRETTGRADLPGAALGGLTPPRGALGGSHRMLSSLSASAIAMSKRFLPEHDAPAGLLQRLGAQTVVAATVRALQLLGRQFVLGEDIDAALAQAARQRGATPGLRFSYDMLGEGARSEPDAQAYFGAYAHALERIAGAGRAASPQAADGISIKLSALFPRYEEAQRARVFAELLPRVERLIARAAQANLNLTIDAEESERLELSLDLIDACAARIAAEHPGWTGFGLAVQAYQTRALDVVGAVAAIARRHGLRFMVRLVKGAYWDSEVKRAQELGLSGYPVYTHKHHTDLSYLACARALLDHADVIYPQFATHNAGTIAAILAMAGDAPFELQRLHGMGEGIYREVSRQMPSPAGLMTTTPRPLRADAMTTTPPPPPAQAGGLARGGVPLRVYAPVGRHRDLLAYLVRRLLENGANSSFVHQLADTQVDVETLLASPLTPASQPGLPAPADLFGAGARRNSAGRDLACEAHLAPLMAAVAATRVVAVAPADPADIDAVMQRLHQGHLGWNATPLAERAAVLRRCADRLEADLPAWCGVLVHEGRKTMGDAVSEVREAIDFCRYYADEAQTALAPRTLPGPTGESNELRLHGRGVFVCISPWNVPLAIFTGQVVAALVAGNAVAAKPAEQTPAVAARMVALLHACGVPADALALLPGTGERIGAALVAHPLAAGVCFTGSTAVA
ncbi:MAG: proline dehydrogenase family protein, partial [Burkholderiaceae bacterium]